MKSIIHFLPFFFLLPMVFPLTLRKSSSDPPSNQTLSATASLTQNSTNTTNSQYSYHPLRGDITNSSSHFKESLATNVVITDTLSTNDLTPTKEFLASNYDNLGPDADKFLFIGSGRTSTSLQEIARSWKTPVYAAK